MAGTQGTQEITVSDLIPDATSELISSSQYELELEQLEQRRKRAIELLKNDLKKTLIELSKFGVHLTTSEVDTLPKEIAPTVAMALGKYVCKVCGQEFTNRYGLAGHGQLHKAKETTHVTATFVCNCGRSFEKAKGLMFHRVRSMNKLCRKGVR